jgi:peptidoglycan/LPS O-acetylase OafA/YrhL
VKGKNFLKINYEERVYGLDVFRAVAILIVVIGHGSFLINHFLPGFPFIPLPDGVELFFVLSGFLIGSILLKTYNKEKKPDYKMLIRFWKRRWLRTLPAYYVVLILNILLVYLGIIKGDISQFSWKFFLFLHNFSSPFTDFFWESWSLSIEEWFYILTPVTISAVFLLFKEKINPKNVFLIVILVYIITPLLYRFSISGVEVDEFWFDARFRKIVLTRLDAIMFGVLFAWIKYYFPGFWIKGRIYLFGLGMILVYSVVLYKFDPNSLFAKTFYFSILGLGSAMLLPLADYRKSARTLFGKTITHISVVSYSMYLLNLSMIAQVIENNFMPQSKTGFIIMYALYWIFVILLSSLFYRFVEKPFIDMRAKDPSVLHYRK